MSRKKNLSGDDHWKAEIAEEILEQIHGPSRNGNGNGNGNGIHNQMDLKKMELLNVSLKIKCLNEKQKQLRRAIEDKQVVICTGPAGTGKTYLSLLTALSIMKKEPLRYRQLKLVKSLQTLPGENPGTLPGTLEEKLDPHMISFTGNLDKILGWKSTRMELQRKEVIEFQPLAYVRGVTIDDAIVIIDEAQNIDMHTFKTIITRIGKNCKMIFLGDVEQIDRRVKSESCLSQVSEMFQGFEHSESVKFTAEESVRNPIIPELLDLLKEIK